MIQYWKWWLTDQEGHSEGCGQAAEMGQHQPLQFNNGKCKALLLRSTYWEPKGKKEAEKAEEGLRFLVDIKLTMSLQTTFVAKKFNSMWAALGKTTSSRSSEGNLPLC